MARVFDVLLDVDVAVLEGDHRHGRGRPYRGIEFLRAVDAHPAAAATVADALTAAMHGAFKHVFTVVCWH